MLYESLLEWILLLVVTLLGIRWTRNRYRQLRNPLGLGGKLIWIDRGVNTKPFFNHRFQVFGKPDFLYQIFGGVMAVEYKSRFGPVYESDIVQAKCAALAARSAGFKVTKVLVITQSVRREISLPGTDRQLFKDISIFVDQAKNAKSGMACNAEPSVKKCSSCAFIGGCRYAL